MIKLQDVIEAFEVNDENFNYCYYIKEDRMVMIPEETIALANCDTKAEEVPKWQEPDLQLAYLFLDEFVDEFIRVPII